MYKLLSGAALALSLTFAATASADSNKTFDNFNLGSVDGQFDWKATGPYDQKVVDAGNGGKALRISNAVTAGSLGDMPFSAPVAPAGENLANKVLVNEFSFRSADPGHEQSGLAMSVSPTNGRGDRMSYVRLEDTADDVMVVFVDTPSGYVNPAHHVSFESQDIATLDRKDPHTIRFETTFVPGQDNDVVRVFVDGVQKVCGESWENYYRYDVEQQAGNSNTVQPSDRLMWRLGGTAAPGTRDHGFLFDSVTSTSSAAAGPAACSLPVGPQGPAGENGKDAKDGANGANGTNGATGATGATGPAAGNGTTAVAAGAGGAKVKIGATKRTLHVPSIKGMKLLGVRASLRGKHLPVHGTSVKADLRGKVVGNYNVSIVARYKTKSGKVHTVRSIRSLSITIR